VPAYSVDLELLVGAAVGCAREHGVVGLDVVLAEELGRNDGRDVEKRVTLRRVRCEERRQRCHGAEARVVGADYWLGRRTMPRRDIAGEVAVADVRKKCRRASDRSSPSDGPSQHMHGGKSNPTGMATGRL
jgi:hypothetical protein